ncbi:MAG TPA: ATP-grasp domain-containing protein [Ensifer sp.]|jgi:carbamoyl-phosphate synthase large subunit|uniref:ATP-grasp domain-containing protein n=1 Tax=Ensifer sp. TaxID=1872086 RepID=UPI002E111945|nr:ATP-grasp domain-containing protein [Ensifer sp.]
MAQRSLNILVSSAGRRVGLIECFRGAARALEIDLKVFACDLDPDLSAACAVADRAFTAPPYDHPEFASRLAGFAREHDIRLIVPTIDPELLPLAAAVDDFAHAGCHVHVSAPTVIDVVRDKLQTMRVLEAAAVPVPRTGMLEEVRDELAHWHWPLFLKPNAGSASRLISVVRSQADLPDSTSEPMILQQYLDGPEHTVNAFVDAGGKLVSVISHRRLRIRAGEVEKGVTERHPLHRAMAEGIVRALPALRGVFCFQVIDDRKTGPRVIEINARFGGGYPLVDHAGATFARFLLEEVAGLPSTAHDNWREGVLMLRYDAAVFRG